MLPLPAFGSFSQRSLNADNPIEARKNVGVGHPNFLWFTLGVSG